MPRHRRLIAEPTRPPFRGWQFLVTCEHASNELPPEVDDRWSRSPRRLQSHLAFDLGASGLARTLSKRLRCGLVLGTVSRLAVDLNRSLHNPAVWPPAVRRWPAERRDRLRRLHERHWSRVRRLVEASLEADIAVVHLAVHSFTPVLDGQRRSMDVGLLYDPSRAYELQFCRAWQQAWSDLDAELTIRRNAPYRGVSDGLTRALRIDYPADGYLGIELELNQRHVVEGRFPEAWVPHIVASSRRAAHAVLGGPARQGVTTRR